MLSQIANALQEYNDDGFTIIVEEEGNDPRVVAEYVISVLKGLKCSFDHYYNDVEHAYTISDNMTERD